MNIKKLLLMAFMCTSGLIFTACGKKNEATDSAVNSNTKESAQIPTLDRRSASNRKYVFLDMSWKTLPQAEMEKVRSQLRDIYWSHGPKNLDEVALDFSAAYRRETDSFKRADLVKTITGELNQDYDNAQKVKDFSVKTDNSQISIYPYDSKIGGFRVGFSDNLETQGTGVGRDADRDLNSGSLFIRFVGVPFRTKLIYKPKDEAQAREIEAALSGQRENSNGDVYVYALFSGSVAGSLALRQDNIALFTVDTIGIIDRKTGKTLFTMDSKELGPIKVACKSTREALKLPEPEFDGGVMVNGSTPGSDC